MAEFVVGQWVEVIDGMAGYLRVGHVQQIEKITDIGTIKLFGNGNCWDASRFKPFVWQVGKTYRTTLEGVTATIKSLSSSSVSADASDKPGTVCFHLCTGKLLGMESREDQPHLLPFLADEPSASTRSRDEAKAAIDRHDASETSESTPPLNGELPPLLSRYHRRIRGVVVDLYDLAEAYGVTGHAEFHALKKIIMAGNRGCKSREQDLAEAEQSIQRARELAKGGES